MNISLKNLFNAEHENCELCCFVGTINKSETRFYVWVNDIVNDIVEQYELTTYMHLISMVDSLPMNEKDKKNVLLYFNSFDTEWETTEEHYIPDNELLERWNDGEEEL